MPTPSVLHSDLFPAHSELRTGRDRGLREPGFKLLFPVFLLSIICTSCSVVGSGPAPPLPVSVTVMPNSAQPFPGVNVQFNAVVENASSPAVTWQVNQVAGGNPTVGTITTNGYYTAPNSVPNPATVTVTAVLQVDSTKSGSASVTIRSLSSIQGLTLSPKLSSVTTSQTLQLKVLPDGVSSTDVNWAVDGFSNGSPAVGTLSTSGVPSNAINYSPPSTPGSHLITAILKENTGATDSATVEVTDFLGTLTWRNDNSRSGVNNRELALDPATVNSSTFGKLFSCPLDGYAYAEPLYVPNLVIPGSGTHNVIFVATEKDSVFAFDADASPCVPLWRASLIPAGSQAVPTSNMDITSTDIIPSVGITGTPVISTSASALYAVAMTSSPGTAPAYDERLYALDLATGQPKIQPAGMQVNTPASQTATFEAMLENQRAALLLDNGVVYIAFGSFHGHGEYHGWLFGYDSVSLQQTGIFDVTPNTTQGGIWQSGGGPSADASHNVFVLTGDGPFDANRGGMSYSDSFLRLTIGAAGLSVSDYFAPCDQVTLQTAALDFGASAAVLLPDSAGSASQPHLAVGGSKSGSLYVMNRDNPGQFTGACPDGPPRAQTVPVRDGAILGTPLYWNSAIFVAAGNGTLKSFPMSGGSLASTALASQSPEALGPQGSTPVISSNGSNNAILWLIDTSGALATPNAPAVLRAFDPSNLSNEVYNSAMNSKRDSAGLAVKFTVPTVANGKVYVGTQTELDVYGLLN